MKGRVRFSILSLLIVLSVLWVPRLFHIDNEYFDPTTTMLKDLIHQDNFDFRNFDNNTGVDHFIVPNIIHYVRFKKKSLNFVEYICFRSAYIRQKPDYIIIHTDVVGGFRGKYWNWIQQEPDLKSRIVILPVEMPSEIFGQPIKEAWRLHHGSDIARIRIMMKYGGIYLDNDVYVVNSLDKYRKYEMTVSWPNNETLGNMIFIGNRNARFLRLYLDNYRDYRDEWYYNSGDGPVKEILMKQPELVHRVEKRLGTTFRMREMYQEKSDVYNWRDNLDAVHLLVNHRHYLDLYFKEYRYFNEHNIQHYPFNFGEMARVVLNSLSNQSFLKKTLNPF